MSFARQRVYNMQKDKFVEVFQKAKELNVGFDSDVSDNNDPALVHIDEDNTFEEHDVEVNLFK